MSNEILEAAEAKKQVSNELVEVVNDLRKKLDTLRRPMTREYDNGFNVGLGTALNEAVKIMEKHW